MTYLTSAPITRALVAAIRANAPLKAAMRGGIHEGFAPEKAVYPFAVYDVVPTPYEDAWGSRMIVCIVDVSVYSSDKVEAENLDQSINETLEAASLSVDGQDTLICRRTGDIRLPDRDEEGRKVYRFGGSYEIWTDQQAS